MFILNKKVFQLKSSFSFQTLSSETKGNWKTAHFPCRGRLVMFPYMLIFDLDAQKQVKFEVMPKLKFLLVKVVWTELKSKLWWPAHQGLWNQWASWCLQGRAATQLATIVKTTLYQCWCNVMTLHQYWHDVAISYPLMVRHVYLFGLK